MNESEIDALALAVANELRERERRLRREMKPPTEASSTKEGRDARSVDPPRSIPD